MLTVVAGTAVVVVALLHAWFMVLEMFLWTRPLGRRTFGLTAEFAQATKGLAANQGLYNGFLVAGLVWGLCLPLNPVPGLYWAFFAAPNGAAIECFFLGCVVVAGLFGAATVSRRILFVQALPGAIALALVIAASR